MPEGTENYPNYFNVNYPDNKPLVEFGTDERRAYILDRAIDLGSPRLINQCDMADKFDVDQSQISRDINKAIVKSINQHLDGDEFRARLLQIWESLLREVLEEEEDIDKKRKMVNDWEDWLYKEGILDKEPDKVEVNHNLVEVSEDLINHHDDGD